MSLIIPVGVQKDAEAGAEAADEESSGPEDEEEEESEAEEYLEDEEGYEVDSEVKKTKKIEKTAEKDDKTLRSMMLSKRKRRILEKINYGKASKKDVVEKLKAKKKTLQK
jgi:pescadillo protein